MVGVREMAGSFGVARSEGLVENVYSPSLKREELFYRGLSRCFFYFFFFFFLCFDFCGDVE